MTDYRVRILANACITRYDRGEGTIDEILASYNLVSSDATLVKACIMAKRPDIIFAEETVN